MRLFVGVFPSDDFRQALAAATDPLRGLVKKPVWVRTDDYHLTVAFLGEVQEKNLPAVSERLRQIVLNFSPLNLRVRGFDILKNRQGLVGAVAFQRSSKFERLNREIYSSLSDLCQRRRTDEKEIRPHLTIFRTKTSSPKEETEGKFAELSLELRDFSFPVKMLSLVQSELSSSGPRYQVLRHFPLGPII